MATDVRNHGEETAVKHVGAWISETGRTYEETSKRRSVIAKKATAVTKLWKFGGT